MADSRTEERFMALETKVAYQEKLLAELNDVLLERGNEVDKLQRRIDGLEKLVREGPEETPGHEPPPHY